jgi:ribose transport system permease protein/rhamnose transport system permease protein
MTATTTRLLGLSALWLVLLVILAAMLPFFFQASTVTSVLQFSTILALVTLGQSFVVLSGGGGIDLSVGGMVSLAGLAMAAVIQAGLGSIVGVLAAIALGTFLGLVNGTLITRLAIVPLIATLGSGYVYAGLAIALTGGAPVGGIGTGLTDFGRGVIGVVPTHFAVLVLPAYALAGLALRFTPAGPWVYALGANETAARLTGIPVGRVRVVLYGLSGFLAGLAAVVATAWLGSARPNIGQNLELESLTAALLGGISISGGSGSILAPLAAVLFLISLKTGIQLANLNTIWQVGTIGLLLVVAVLADRFVLGRHKK